MALQREGYEGRVGGDGGGVEDSGESISICTESLEQAQPVRPHVGGETAAHKK